MPGLLSQGALAKTAPTFSPNSYQPNSGLLQQLAQNKAEEDERKRKEEAAKRMAASDIPKIQPLAVPSSSLTQMNQSKPIDFGAYKPMPLAPIEPAPMSVMPTIRNQMTQPVLDVAKSIGASVARFPFSAGVAAAAIPLELAGVNVKYPEPTHLPGIASALGPISNYQKEAVDQTAQGQGLLKTLGKTAFNVAVDEPVGFAMKPVALGLGLAARSLFGGSDDVLKAIAMSESADDIAKMIKTSMPDISDDVVRSMSDDLLKIKTVPKVQSYFDDVLKRPPVDAIPDGIIHGEEPPVFRNADEVAKELEQVRVQRTMLDDVISQDPSRNFERYIAPGDRLGDSSVDFAEINARAVGRTRVAAKDMDTYLAESGFADFDSLNQGYSGLLKNRAKAKELAKTEAALRKELSDINKSNKILGTRPARPARGEIITETTVEAPQGPLRAMRTADLGLPKGRTAPIEATRVSDVPLNNSPLPETLPPTGINLNRYQLNDESRAFAEGVADDMDETVRKLIGRRLSHAEVQNIAKTSGRTMQQAVGRLDTLKWEAQMKNTADRLNKSLDEGKVTTETIRDFLTMKTAATDIGRKLESFKIKADPSQASIASHILDAIYKVTDNVDEIVKASKGLDLNNANDAAKLYRQFVKPKAKDWIELIRYNSMLSSPTTHIINIASNLVNSLPIAPIEKGLAGAFDLVGSAITGSPRKQFAGEAPAYVAGYAKNAGKAFKDAIDVIAGRQTVEHLDARFLPLHPEGGWKGGVEKSLAVPTRFLEAMDRFFMALAEGGETAALKYRVSKGVKVPLFDIAAKDAGKYRIFRQELHDPAQGVLLNAVDDATSLMESLRNASSRIPDTASLARKRGAAAIETIARFTVPFLRTPMNILKQGVEYSPVGFATIPGAENKAGQLAKAVMGSSVAFAAATMLTSGRMTWAEPRNATEKSEWRAAGKQPYSVKFGDTWYSYQKLPPLIAFPFALTAAVHDVIKQKQANETTVDAILSAFAKSAQFYSDQSYMRSIGDLVAAAQGDEAAISQLISNYPTQLIPYRALSGWIARLGDEYERMVDKDATWLDKQVELLMMQIPGARELTTPRLGPDGQPIYVPTDERLFNALSPVRASEEVGRFAQFLEARDFQRAEERKLKTAKEMQEQKPETKGAMPIEVQTQNALNAGKEAQAKQRILETKGFEVVGEKIIYVDEGQVKTKELDNVGDAKAEIEKIKVKQRLRDDKTLYNRMSEFDKYVQSLKGAGGWTKAETANKNAILAKMSPEKKMEYEAFLSMRTSERAKNSTTVRDLLYPNPRDAIQYMKSLGTEEAERIWNNMTEDEKQQLARGR